MAATSFIRSLGVPCSQYIEDCHIGQLSPSPEYRSSVGDWSDLEFANAAIFIGTFYSPIQVFAYPCSSGQIPWIFG